MTKQHLFLKWLIYTTRLISMEFDRSGAHELNIRKDTELSKVQLSD